MKRRDLKAPCNRPNRKHQLLQQKTPLKRCSKYCKDRKQQEKICMKSPFILNKIRVELIKTKIKSLLIAIYLLIFIKCKHFSFLFHHVIIYTTEMNDFNTVAFKNILYMSFELIRISHWENPDFP